MPPEATIDPVLDPAPAPVAENHENSTIKAMRDAVEAANRAKREMEAQLKAMADRLKAREDLDLSETDKLRRENEELKPLLSSHAKLAARMEALYENELASVTEDKREAVKTLSTTGDWADRLEALKAAKVLIAPAAASGTTTPAPVVAQPMGTASAPGRGPLPVQTERIDPTKLSWSEAIHRNKPAA